MRLQWFKVRLSLVGCSVHLSQVKDEMEMLEEEYNRLQERHSRLITDRQEVEVSWRRKLEASNLEATMASTEHLDTIQQLTHQNKLLASSFKEQIAVLHADHNQKVQLLQSRLDQSAQELARLRNSVNITSTSTVSYSAYNPHNNEGVVEVINDPQKEERGTGEVCGRRRCARRL